MKYKKKKRRCCHVSTHAVLRLYSIAVTALVIALSVARKARRRSATRKKKSEKPKEKKKKEGKKEESRKQENTKKKREHLLPQKGLFFFFDFTLKSCEGEHCLVERKKKSCLKLVFELYRKYQIEKDFLKKRNLFIKRQFVSKHKEKGKGERKEKRFHVMQKKKITFLFFFFKG